MKNRYEVRGDVTAIFLNKRDGSVLEAFISTNKLAELQKLDVKWCAHWAGKKWYVKSSRPKTKGQKIDLHRYLMNAPKGLVVDHRNHNGLDNTDNNLVVTTRAGNRYNMNGVDSNNTSGATGVWYHKRNRRWIAEIWIDGVKKNLGSYEEKEDAVSARREVEKQIVGRNHN